MAEIEEEVQLSFYAKNLSLNTSLGRSTISINDIGLSEGVAASIAYFINNPRNLLSAEIKLSGRIPEPE